MTTAQLVILCLTVLATITIVAVITARTVADYGRRGAFASSELKAASLALQEATTCVIEPLEALNTASMAVRGLARMQAEAPTRTNHRVTVHTKIPDDQTIFGVVVYDGIDRISLENAEYVTANGTTPLKGRQDIAKVDIAFIDVHQLVVEQGVAESKSDGTVVAMREVS